MQKKQIKLETYLLFTNFFQGIFWIFSGIIELLKHNSIPIMISKIAIPILILFIIVKGLFSPRENFDELSRKVKESVDSNVLELGLSFFLIIVICLDILKTLDIISIIPWLPIIEFYIGIMYCFQYIGFIIVMKKKLIED